MMICPFGLRSVAPVARMCQRVVELGNSFLFINLLLFTLIVALPRLTYFCGP